MVYLMIAFAAALGGSMTGMGGGVFIKPVLDFLGSPDAASISVLSGSTVFVMAGVALLKGRHVLDKPDKLVSATLSIGAAAGGYLGERLFATMIGKASPAGVKIRQNAVLIALVIGVIIYMSRKDRLASPNMSGIACFLAAGLALGVVSSFLGIGGGPINVAVIVFLFAYPTKAAMQLSLTTILFSQAAKLITVLFAGNLARYDVSLLPFMLVGGASGGFLGSVFNKKLTNESSARLFLIAQCAVICICAANIVCALDR